MQKAKIIQSNSSIILKVTVQPKNTAQPVAKSDANNWKTQKQRLFPNVITHIFHY